MLLKLGRDVAPYEIYQMVYIYNQILPFIAAQGII